MPKPGSVATGVRALALALLSWSMAAPVSAADIYVPPGGDLQAALNAAIGGDTVLLAPGTTYTGNYTLPVHAGDGYVTVRTASGAASLPVAGERITPGVAPYLARLVSPNTVAALRTAAGAAYWRIELLEVGPGPAATMALVELGDGSKEQNRLDLIPHHLVLDRVYVHGDPLAGQKRGIGLNSATTTITGSYVSDIKAVAQDSQAIGGSNGPGPYVIENNYLESAGTSILFGGDDPRIVNLVPSDIRFRDNTVTRPLSWRDPILPSPTGVRASFGSGGSLAAATYGYRVVARRMIGSTPVKSAASAEVTVAVTAGARVTVQWNAVADASDYLVYGRTVGSENRYWIVKGTSFTDDGVVSSSSGTPSSATVWQVKNLFELKNARRVEVSHNLFANNWGQAQSGTAVLFTPRNQYGACTWCVVEDVTFESNVLRGIGAGFQITGWDNLKPSQQGNNLRIRHNLVIDLSKSWGGRGYLVTLTDAPRDVTVDHNTIISPDGAGIVMADGDPITGFVFTNNVARHNSYGIFGSGYSVGNKTLAYYFPGSLVTRNVLAGGSKSLYPSGNEFPTIASFEAHFLDYANGNYALQPGTDWEGTGSDGLDLGADMTKVAGAGSAPAGPIAGTLPPLHLDTTSLPDATAGELYTATLTASGGAAPYGWTIAAGALPAGLFLDGGTGSITGSAIAAGDFAVTVGVNDLTGAVQQQNLSLHVSRTILPVTITTGALASVAATVPFSQALEATGGLGTYRWSTLSLLPAGLTLSSEGVLSGTTSAQGTYSVGIIATDAQDATRSATQYYSLYVAPPPNSPPTVTLLPPADAAVPVGQTLTLTAYASDVDGNLARVDFYVGSSFLGSSVGPSFTMPWLAASGGTYQFTALAVDTRGETGTSQTISMTTTAEIVIYAADATAIAGNYQLVTDSTAAAGVSLSNPDLGVAKLAAAAATPAHFAEFRFYAEAGRPYRLWIRGRALKNSWANDSAFVQFSGVANARIGTTSAYVYNLEQASNAGVSGWGWEDNGWGVGVLGPYVVFDTTGPQTIRIQPREDGLSIDQIVLSPERYLTVAPGGLKNDATIVPR